MSVNQAERVSQKKLLNCIMGSEPDWYNGLNVRITAVCWILTILFYVILSRVLQLYEVQYYVTSLLMLFIQSSLVSVTHSAAASNLHKLVLKSRI